MSDIIIGIRGDDISNMNNVEVIKGSIHLSGASDF